MHVGDHLLKRIFDWRRQLGLGVGARRSDVCELLRLDAVYLYPATTRTYIIVSAVLSKYHDVRLSYGTLCILSSVFKYIYTGRMYRNKLGSDTKENAVASKAFARQNLGSLKARSI